MKKKFLICILITLLSIAALFTQEQAGLSLGFNKLGFDLPGISLNTTFNNFFNNYSLTKYSKVLSETDASNLVKKIETANTVVSVLAMVGYTSNAVLGAFVLYEKFMDQPYWNGFLYTHIPLGLTSGLLGATVISLGYVDVALRKKYNLFNNKANAISVYINTGLAAAEIGFVVANLITSRFNPEAAKWVGLVHAITTTSFLIGLTVQFGTSFIKE